MDLPRSGGHGVIRRPGSLAQLGLRWPRLAVDELLLDRGEEALGDGVVKAVALAARRLRDAGFAGLLAERRQDRVVSLPIDRTRQQAVSALKGLGQSVAPIEAFDRHRVADVVKDLAQVSIACAEQLLLDRCARQGGARGRVGQDARRHGGHEIRNTRCRPCSGGCPT